MEVYGSLLRNKTEEIQRRRKGTKQERKLRTIENTEKKEIINPYPFKLKVSILLIGRRIVGSGEKLYLMN